MREKHLKEQGLADLAYRAEADHEVQMARADLYKIAKYGIKLHEMLKNVSEAEGLEGWVQAKITKAADYLGSVYHHLDYEQKFDEVTESNKKLDEDLGKAVNHLMAATGEISKSIAGGAVHGTAYGIGAATQAPKALKKSFQKGKAAGKKALGDSIEEAEPMTYGGDNAGMRIVSSRWNQVMGNYLTGKEDLQSVLDFLEPHPVDHNKLIGMLQTQSTNPKFAKFKSKMDQLTNALRMQSGATGNPIGATPAQMADPANQQLMQKARRMDAMGDSVDYKDYLGSLLERKLSKGEEKKKEKFVKGMKKSDSFDKYDDPKAVMYATATKMAKKKKTESASELCSECGNPSWRTLDEEKQKGVDGKVCWKGYKRMGTKKKGGKTVDNCVKM